MTGAGGSVTLRHDLRPGDVGWIVERHGSLYAREHRFGVAFEAYVAAPLGELVARRSLRERAWIAERGGARIGCIALADADAGGGVAQLRWFLVEPEARGAGVGRRLVAECLAFAREAGYATVILWTVSQLHAAARLYEEAGFRKVESKPSRAWGVDVVEERYELRIGSP